MKRAICFVVALGSFIRLASKTEAQWVQTLGPLGIDVNALAVSGTNLFAGTYGTSGGVFLSTNYGATWTAVNTGLTSTRVLSLAVLDTNLFAGTHGSVFLSINNGTSWTRVNTGLTNTNLYALAVSGTNLFAGTLWGGGVFLSTNNGTSWTEVNAGLTSTSVYALAVSGTNLFAGTVGGVWRRPLSEMIAGVEGLQSALPEQFSLGQNYPNPFNPNTKIQFGLPRSSYVTLKVYDLLGREVSSLMGENLPVGSYETQWKASGYPSGVYFYRIVAGSFVETRKMILAK
jgi:hypothetical protein